MNSKQFPEGFFDKEKSDLEFNLPRSSIRQIEISPFLGEAQVVFRDAEGEAMYDETHPLSVAEIIVRALLLGRENFSVPSSNGTASVVLKNFFSWFEEFEDRLEDEIDESSLGTGYEEIVSNEILSRLGVHPEVGTSVLPRKIDLNRLTRPGGGKVGTSRPNSV